MKKIYMDIVKRNMLMTSELNQTIKILKKNDIDVIPFKGPILSQIAYGDVISRQYVDLDILVKEKDLDKAYKILENNEYLTDLALNLLLNKIYIKKSSDIQFYNKRSNVLLEIHWQLFRNEFSEYNFNNLIFNNLKSIKLNDQEIKVFSTEFNLVYLCSHATKHTWERIEWIVDIDKLIRNSKNINWDLVKKISNETNSTKMLELGLFLTNKLFKTNIPNNILIDIGQKKYEIFILIIIENFLLINENRTDFQNNWNAFKFNYLFQQKVVLKMKFIFKTIFSIKDRDIVHISSSNNPFIVYKNRLLRLMKKYF